MSRSFARRRAAEGSVRSLGARREARARRAAVLLDVHHAGAGEHGEREHGGKEEQLHGPALRQSVCQPPYHPAIAETIDLNTLVENGTMPRPIASTLREAARARRSFLVMAVPRLAGKTTVKAAILAERPKGAPVRTVGEDGDDIDLLLAQSANGYIDIPEISQHPVAPGYIWGTPVRRVFAGISTTVALAVALHAADPDEAFEIICGGCGVPDADAAKLSLVVYLRSFGKWQAPTRPARQALHQIVGAKGGQPTPPPHSPREPDPPQGPRDRT